MSVPLMAFEANAQFDHYIILAPLGKGGMGEVYRARDTRLNREVALKVLPESFAQDADRLSRFEQEALATSALNHPNILTVHDFGLHEGNPFIVMELLEGEELRAQLRNGALPIPKAIDYAEQIAAGLATAHEKGIVHRDLKPENLFVTHDGRVKILDFGLAKLARLRNADRGMRIEEDAATLVQSPDGNPQSAIRIPQLTNPGTVMGTASYMSPEQARGEKVDARSDLFSLGVVLYEMIAGQRPFAGANMLDIVGAVLHQEPKPLPNETEAAQPELQRIVSKALQKDRERRYQTSKDLLLDLQTLKHELTIADFRMRNADSESKPTPSAIPNPQSAIEPPTTSSTKIILSELNRHKLGVALTLGLLLLTVIGYFAFFYRSNNTPIDSLAILPFTNASGDPEMEYLSDGLTESLINSLAQLPSLRVLPRTTVFRFKGKTDDPQRIGKELGVRAVLTGRVQQRGDSLVIQTELIDVTGGAQLWGEGYDRKPSDLLATKREVTQAIASGLRLKLSGAEQQQLAKKGTENNDAYQLYLKGQFWRNKAGRVGCGKGIEYFNQALEKDPNYAPAWAALAHCYTNLGNNVLNENYAKGKAAAFKALALDNNLAEAHVALGFSLFTFDWDFAGAEREFKRAKELDPDSAIAHRNYASYLSAIGRSQEAIAEAEHALQLDPLTTNTSNTVGSVYLYARQYDQAIEQYRKLLEMDREYANSYTNLIYAYVGKGKYEEAIAIAQAGLKVAPDNPAMLAHLGYAYARAGQRGEAQKILAQLLTLAKQRGVPPTSIAQLYAALGDQNQAFAWLEKAYEARIVFLLYLKVSPRWDSLRSDPRFADLVRRIGLPE